MRNVSNAEEHVAIRNQFHTYKVTCIGAEVEVGDVPVQRRVETKSEWHLLGSGQLMMGSGSSPTTRLRAREQR